MSINPLLVANRDVRAETDAVALFIAELIGAKAETKQLKTDAGYNAWINHSLHTLNPNSEDDRSEFHENIWLQRLYDQLDQAYNCTNRFSRKAYLVRTPISVNWSVPLELDASASMLQWMGVLLGDQRLCEMTNILGDTLSDPWHFDGIPRKQFKAAATPLLYGSSQATHQLWKDGGFEYTQLQLQLFNQELSNGAFGLANLFKEFIINNVKPQETMQVQIYNELINIECNRFKHIGEETIQYDIYDTITDSIRTINHTTTKSIPDLEQFRRYFVTLLIHNLDSQAANYVAEKCYDKYGFVIDIHDAFIVSPIAAYDVRQWYKEKLIDVYNNRQTILANFFKSIGIEAEAQAQWNAVKAMVQPITEFNPTDMALK